MTYFNYHAKLKNLIKSGNCIGVSLLYKYHTIKPAMVFYFNNHKPMPVRDYRWNEYFPLIKQYNIKLDNPDNLHY
ncbi:MAG: thermostable hemolysin delta-VPH [Clostridia bacterium]|nr:thermostable hemolysin delta-VPH [Clostridia bacterium]